MKFKTSAIALAVAGTIAAPVVVQAEGSVYASARVGLVYEKTDDTDTFSRNAAGTATTTVGEDGTDQADIRSMSSRFGARGETDLGNGMTGFGRYEWDVDENDFSIRHRYVGVKGDFGSVTMGKTYGTFYNNTVGPVDIPWWGAGYAMVDYVGREDNQLTYAGTAGNISFGVTLIIKEDADEEDVDVVELGGSIPVGDSTIGLGVRAFQGDDDKSTSIDEEEAIMSATWSGIALGDFTLGFNVQQQDDDESALADIQWNNAYLHVEYHSIDVSDSDKISTTVGYTQSLGRNTTMWYEIQVVDQDDSGSETLSTTGGNDTFEEAADLTVVRAILKYDIL